MLLHPPNDVRTKSYGERRFDKAAPTLWNNLPLSLRKIKFVSDRSVVFSTNKTDCHDNTEILLKVALNTINQPTNQRKLSSYGIRIYIYYSYAIKVVLL
jgi:hypothetical protein